MTDNTIKGINDTKGIRSELQQLKSYHVPQLPRNALKLDAMEAPFNIPETLKDEFFTILNTHLLENLHRYPESHTTLHQKIMRTFAIDDAQYGIVCGNGSDELIHLLTQATSGLVMGIEPSFVMYHYSSTFNQKKYLGINLNEDFSFPLDTVLQAIEEHQPTLFFLGYPNNPTGTLYEKKIVESLIQAMKPHGILVIDEAYQPFATHSYLNYNDLCNLPEHVVIIRTVSKMGLAGIRFGYMVGHKHITDIINAIRPPYNLNQLTMATMNFIFDENYYATIIEQAQSLVPQRELLKQELINLNFQVFESQTNFLLIRPLFKHINASQIHHQLQQLNIFVKNTSNAHELLANTLRITVSHAQENHAFIVGLKKVL